MEAYQQTIQYLMEQQESQQQNSQQLNMVMNPQQYTIHVSGAGTRQINGKFHYHQMSNSRPSWANSDKVTIWWNTSYQRWYIGEPWTWPFSDKFYYENKVGSPIPGDDQWITNKGTGAEPPPRLKYIKTRHRS